MSASGFPNHKPMLILAWLTSMFDDPIREFLKDLSAGSPVVWAVFVVVTVVALTLGLHGLLDALLRLAKQLRRAQQ